MSKPLFTIPDLAWVRVGDSLFAQSFQGLLFEITTENALIDYCGQTDISGNHNTLEAAKLAANEHWHSVMSECLELVEETSGDRVAAKMESIMKILEDAEGGDEP